MSTTTTSAPSRCRGTTKRGTRCRIDWDLNGNQLCKYHELQALVLDGNGDPAPTPEKPSPPPLPLAPPSVATTGSDDSTPRTTASAASPPAASPSTTPVWTAQYIVSTRTIVLRMYSEWSWQCHEPILITVSRWGCVGETPIKCGVRLAREVPVLGGLLEHTEGAMIEKVRDSIDLQKILKIMGAEGSCVFESDCSNLPKHVVKLLLEILLQLKYPTSNQQLQELNLFCRNLVPDASNSIWVFQGEFTKGKPMTRQPKPADASVYLLFERVSWGFVDDSVDTTIDWELRKGDPQSEPIASGIACANERVPVRSVRRAELGHCVLTVKVHKKRWLVGDLVASGDRPLAGIPLSANDRDGEHDRADDPALEPFHVGWGRVVHFRILTNTSQA